MKKYLILLILIIPASFFAQGRWMFGLNGGINLCFQKENYSEGYEYQNQFYSGSRSTTINNPAILSGIEFGYYYPNSVSFRVQVHLDQKRYTRYDVMPDAFAGDSRIVTTNTNNSQYSILIPLTIEVPLTGNDWQSFASVGPVLGFLFHNSNDRIYSSSNSYFGNSIACYGGIGLSHALSNDLVGCFEAGFIYGASDFLPFRYDKKPLSEFHINFGLLFGN